VRLELARAFARLSERLGFTEEQLRAAALEVLQADEWETKIAPLSEGSSYQE